MDGTVTREDAVQSRRALSLRNLSKAFPGTQALSDVSLDVSRGELHGLLGGNGSGKSTLIKILAGIYAGESGGLIRLYDHEMPADGVTPELSRRYGLRFVHQQVGTFPDLTVAENLALDGVFPRKWGRIDWRQLHREARDLLARFQIDAQTSVRLGDLRPAAQTMVAIARALRDADAAQDAILVLDEPTSALPDAEVDRLLEALRGYADAGQTILYVTHRLGEVVRVADSVTILRDGLVAARLEREDISEPTLISHITGGRQFRPTSREGRTRGRRVLGVNGLVGGPIRGATLEVYEGEIVGIAGLLGSGRTSLLEMLFGVHQMEEGEVYFGDEPWRPRDPAAAIAHGLSYLPEERARRGIFASESLTRNVTILGLAAYRGRLRVDQRKEAQATRSIMQDFDVKAESERDPIRLLSGGNQQKVLMGRTLTQAPRVVLLDEPTQGVDVGARHDLHSAVIAAASRGTAALIVSSDFVELADCCDRVLVLRDGRITSELTDDQVEPHAITEALLMDMEGL